MTIRLAGGLDVLVLGLGKNAHIGFNEPGSDARLKQAFFLRKTIPDQL